MQTRSNTISEAMYTNLKRQYEELLQKNQNDLIKIKIRQKQLNEKIANIQKEKEQLKVQVQTLRNLLQQTGKQPKRQQESSTNLQVKGINMGSPLKDQEIAQLKKKISAIEGANRESQQKKMIDLKDTKDNLDKIKKENGRLKEKIEDIEHNFQENIQKTREQMQGKQQKHQSQLNVLQQKIIIATKDNESLMVSLKEAKEKIEDQRKEIVQMNLDNKKPCNSCIQLQQKVQLHQQMLKSVKMMLKFKEMQLQNLKQ